ncbi:uncharacterized protein LTR77_003111 [Saxophila tyrrhenica]|uniref:Uncharacterized protein n=1 Tax=Saxophila tyrrhenica TaxID=1690608 RepID=A0AAV9PGW4_9PEZI|nr:hypothetical protein LTR77_003111 [Saxophila tyrrhenica]
MSGNPFRKAKGARLPDQQSYPFRTDDDSNDSPPPAPSTPTEKKKKKKTVKIQTPPHSPESPPRRRSSGNISPPPPARTREDDVEESDSTTTADSDLEDALRNTRRNLGSLAPPTQLGFGGGNDVREQGSNGGGGAPYNPFARTLATSEAAFGLQRNRDEGQQQEGGERRDAERNGGASGRPAMNVDQFKNILLGSAQPPSPAPAPTPSSQSQAPAPRFQDSSSNTDASSASQQSLFDPYHEMDSETPRTSFDQMDSPSDSSDDAGDEENSGLMSGTTRLDDFAPPAPPKHNHGRPLTANAAEARGPQTVSFADFDDSVSGGPKRSQNLNVPPLHRSPSDLNKPLPPPPQEPMSPRTTEAPHPASDDSSEQQQEPVSTSTEDPAQAKKAPPPPPPSSRRGGQAASSHARARSTSNITESSSHDDTTSAQQPAPKESEPTPKAAAAPPPPPPSRKTKLSAQPPNPSTEAPSDSPSPAPAAESTKIMPPPPPRRTASKAGSSMHRSPSAASHSSVQRKENSTPSAAAPPAPPPRRGVGSAKRESLDAERTGSGQSGVASPSKEMERDVLADMTAFQAEIDALRKKAEGAG